MDKINTLKKKLLSIQCASQDLLRSLTAAGMKELLSLSLGLWQVTWVADFHRFSQMAKHNFIVLKFPDILVFCLVEEKVHPVVLWLMDHVGKPGTLSS